MSQQSDHNKFIIKAIELAKLNFTKKFGGPFGAIIVKDNKIVGKGFNHVIKNNDPSAHAEIMAIRDACKNLGAFSLEDCVIYSSCEPCPMCFGAIYWAKIESVYYSADRTDAEKAGFDDALIYNELNSEITQRQIPFVRLNPEEGSKVFSDWNLQKFNLHY